MIDELKQYNEYFKLSNSYLDSQRTNVFEFTDKSTQLILSAPHATRTFRNQKEKCADLYTGAIATYLGKTNNVSTLIRVKFTPHDVQISDYITEHNLQNHYFLDIHGFKQDIAYDICLGIGDFKAEEYPYLQNILDTAKKYDLRVAVNYPNYTGRRGLTGQYHQIYKTPNVIQIELQHYLRNFYTNPDAVKNITIPFFNDIIRYYK